jgi:hypothetical protein
MEPAKPIERPAKPIHAPPLVRSTCGAAAWARDPDADPPPMAHPPPWATTGQIRPPSAATGQTRPPCAATGYGGEGHRRARREKVHRHAWEGEGARAAVLGRERLCALPCSGGRGAREGECEGESGGRRRPSGSRLGGRSTTLGCAIAGREREREVQLENQSAPYIRG